MKRYIYDTSGKDVEIHNIDVAVIGSGLAGMYTAYHLDSALNCALFTKDSIEISSSSLAQGGIAAVTEIDDNFTYHFEDTINAGAGMCNEDAVRVIVEEGPKEINELLALGTHFDLDSNGHLLTTREGGHGMNRILHAGGDATGLEMVRTLEKTVKSKDNVTLHENSFVADILTENNHVCGLMVFEDGRWHLYRTGYVVIATGGLGQIFRYTTNPTIATGDGFAMAYRAGAVLENMEFIQFHPTGLYTQKNRNRQCFLISEAVRGEGGILFNEAGQRFMEARHPLAELAPRDIVAREIYREIQNQNLPYVKLDISHKPKSFLTNRFPTIYNTCLQHGIDISTDFIPVGPVQHYMMGGIKTNLWGETNIHGLLACGEVASTGVHGANRLASNSTLECLVFGRRCANVINKVYSLQSAKASIPIQKGLQVKDVDTAAWIIDLKGIMVKYCGIVRNGQNLLYGIRRVSDMLSILEDARLLTIRDMEFYNMATVALNVLTDANKRKESVGAHYRVD
ncbi:MAG: L-aspartate oxidase [Christensenellales bacterium]|jgi:L-aspartate oxidase